MEVSQALPKTKDWPYHEDLAALRVSTLYRLVAMGLTVALVWYSYVAFYRMLIDVRAWSGPLMLASTSGLSYWLATRHKAMPASYLCVGGVAFSVLLAAWSSSNPTWLPFLALSVGAASLLIGAVGGFVVAGIIAVALALTALPSSGLPLPSEAIWQTGIFAFLIALLLWIALYPLRTTLHWTWASYEQARQRTETLMDNRAHLSRTLKDLDLAYKRLETMAVELERARQAANEARRLKAQFAANVSHELRTPLNLIIGFSQMMVLAPQTYDGEPLPSAYRGDVQAIYRNAQHLATLIDDVLDLSQIEAGSMGLVKEPVAVSEIIAEAAAVAAPLVEHAAELL